MKSSVYTSFHSIEELIKSRNQKGILYYSKSGRRIETILMLAGKNGIPVKKTSAAEISSLAEGGEHRGIVFVTSEIPEKSRSGGKNPLSLDEFCRTLESPSALVLILDGVTDPHNLGAILRTADKFDADMVILPSRNSAKDNSTVSRISSGADNYVNIEVVPNLVRAMEQLKKAGFWIYGADMGGGSINSTALTGRIAIVMGSEGKGMRDLVLKNCDAVVSIPAGGHVDSFNVSVAAGIIMYEVRRQQNQ